MLTRKRPQLGFVLIEGAMVNLSTDLIDRTLITWNGCSTRNLRRWTPERKFLGTKEKLTHDQSISIE